MGLNIMKKVDNLKDIQDIELGILEYVVDVCKKNKLRYYLAGGTLLGAIRHQGFIPWDNDIDIAMPRFDFKRLIDIMDQNSDFRYKLLAVKNNNSYCLPFVKVVDLKTRLFELTGDCKMSEMGVFIDIFPIDALSDDEKIALKQFHFVRKWGRRIAGSVCFTQELSIYRKITHMIWFIVFKLLNREKCLKAVESRLKIKPMGNAKYVVSTYGLRGDKEIISSDVFVDTIDVIFEGRKYCAPKGYDKYLKQMYGDYMKLPPKKERIAPHDVEVFIR